MVGSISKRMLCHILRGSVTAVEPETKSATISSSKEEMKAKTAPASTPGRMIGSMTCQKARHGVAPRLSAACSSRRSKP